MVQAAIAAAFPFSLTHLDLNGLGMRSLRTHSPRLYTNSLYYAHCQFQESLDEHDWGGTNV
jgi:hypothetical protein